jgi:MFS family permease
MKSWLLRGLVFAALMVLVRVVQGGMINTWETQALLISVFLVVAFALVALVWGLLDGRADAAAEPDPDRRADLAMTWLIAGLVAGLLSGALTWFISLFYKTIYVEALLNELTTFAAFTALVTFVAAITGVTLGRWLTDREAERRGLAVGRHRTEETADTDVFAAVSGERVSGERVSGERVSGERAEPTTEPQRIQSEEGPEGHAAR